MECHGARDTGAGRINDLASILPDVRAEYDALFPGIPHALVFVEKIRHGQFYGVGGNMPFYTLEALSDEDLGAAGLPGPLSLRRHRAHHSPVNLTSPSALTPVATTPSNATTANPGTTPPSRPMATARRHRSGNWTPTAWWWATRRAPVPPPA